MKLERLTTQNAPLFDKAMALYRVSFPLHEQREAASQAAILAHPDYHFTLLRDGDTFIGDLLYWETPEFRYVEHFCIEPALRGQGFGSRALAMLPDDRPVILEIDPPTDEIAQRRQRFYERCGFTANPFPHVHPPYHADTHGHPLVLMSRPAALTEAQCRAFQAYLRDAVMQNAF